MPGGLAPRVRPPHAWPGRCTAGACATVDVVRRFPAIIALLASASPACLLYTHPINSAPQVTIVAPTDIFPGHITLTADASDPDGESVDLRWSVAEKPCNAVTDEDWTSGDWKSGPSAHTFDVMISGHEPFCVRVIARDPQGAETTAKLFDGTPANRPPRFMLTADPNAGAVPLYGPVHLRAATIDGHDPLSDEDGDPVTFAWKATDPGGAPVMLGACDVPGAGDRCFTPAASGAYVVSVEASDGVKGSTPVTETLSLAVADDAPPCIEASDPSPDIGGVVMAVTDPPRQFEVRRVRDDGNPFPPSMHGRATFQWSIERLGDPSWTRLLGDGYDLSTFQVGAGTFDDARPGSAYRVRVEVRDPAHESMAELHALELACHDDDVCKLPTTSVRWLTWKVSFQ
jgi:hypothetical protein